MLGEQCINKILICAVPQKKGFGLSGKVSACNAGDLGWIPGLDPWVGKIPWRRVRLPTPVFWPREFHELYSPWDHKESNRTERLSLHFLWL